MTELVLSDLVVERIGPLTLRFDVGLTSILSDDTASLAALGDVLVGLAPPKRGAAFFDGVALTSSPIARCRVASMLRTELLPPAPTVEQALAEVLALRQVTASPSACLGALNLARLLPIAPSRLEAGEVRAVAFALALALAEQSSLVVLYEPFALVPLVPARVIEQACRKLARERIALVLLADLNRGLELGARCLLLERGKVSSFGALAATPMVRLFVRSTEATRLADLLQGCPEASEVELRGPELSVSTYDPAALSQKLVSMALQAELDIESISLPNASLPEQLWRRSFGATQ